MIGGRKSRKAHVAHKSHKKPHKKSCKKQCKKPCKKPNCTRRRHRSKRTKGGS